MCIYMYVYAHYIAICTLYVTVSVKTVLKMAHLVLREIPT